MALAGSGLGQTNEVTALHNWWDGLKEAAQLIYCDLVPSLSRFPIKPVISSTEAFYTSLI